MKRPPKKVAKAQWAKWTPEARALFNELFYQMANNQSLFAHPKTEPIEHEQWVTVSWNAAWIAASELSHIQKAARRIKP